MRNRLFSISERGSHPTYHDCSQTLFPPIHPRYIFRGLRWAFPHTSQDFAHQKGSRRSQKMCCALDTMTNKAFTMNNFPDTEIDIAPIEGPHAIVADQQIATSPALPALNDQQGSLSGSGVLDITDGG